MLIEMKGDIATSRHAIASPLKWHIDGGKGAFHGKLAKWIISLMPKHLHYVEPYAGGLSVLLAKNPEGVSEVVNDIHSGLTNFWNVLRCGASFADLKRWFDVTPFGEPAWKSALANLDGWVPHEDGKLDGAAAFHFFVQCRQSLSGRMKDFASITKNRVRRGMNEQVSAWLTTIEGLPDVHARLKRVLILNRDALKVIWEQDGPKTLQYLDPPYLHSTRASKGEYEHEMSKNDHAELLDLLTEHHLKSKFVLSGYRSDMYDRLLNHWNRHEFNIVNNAAGGKKKRVMTECCWTNY